MGRATPKGNEANWKMKHPSDIAGVGFEPSCYRSVATRASIMRLRRWSAVVEIVTHNYILITNFQEVFIFRFSFVPHFWKEPLSYSRENGLTLV